MIAFRSLYLVFTLLLFGSAWAVQGGPESVHPWALPVRAEHVKYVTDYHKGEMDRLRKGIDADQVVLNDVGPKIRAQKKLGGDTHQLTAQETTAKNSIVTQQQRLWRHEEHLGRIDQTPASHYEESAAKHYKSANDYSQQIEELRSSGHNPDLLGDLELEEPQHRAEGARLTNLANDRKRLGFR